MSTEPRVSSTTDCGHVQWPIVHTVPGAAGGVPSAIAVPALPAHVLLEPLVVGRSRGRHVRVRQHQPLPHRGAGGDPDDGGVIPSRRQQPPGLIQSVLRPWPGDLGERFGAGGGGLAQQLPGDHAGVDRLGGDVDDGEALTVALQHRAHEVVELRGPDQDRKSTRLNSSHVAISYAVFCLKKKIKNRSTWSNAGTGTYRDGG